MNKHLLKLTLILGALATSTAVIASDPAEVQQEVVRVARPPVTDLTVDQVVAHANTLPSNYRMDFLQTPEGRAKIQETINDVNGERPVVNERIQAARTAGWGRDYLASTIAHVAGLYPPVTASSVTASPVTDLTVDQVVAHANTLPSNYRMDFLQTPEGRAKIQETINDVNGKRPVINERIQAARTAGWGRDYLASTIAYVAGL